MVCAHQAWLDKEDIKSSKLRGMPYYMTPFRSSRIEMGLRHDRFQDRHLWNLLDSPEVVKSTSERLVRVFITSVAIFASFRNRDR